MRFGEVLVASGDRPDLVRPGDSIQRNAGILAQLAKALALLKEGVGARKISWL
jgi:hypothetical protein